MTEEIVSKLENGEKEISKVKNREEKEMRHSQLLKSKIKSKS